MFKVKSKKIVSLEGGGQVLLERSGKAKHISLSVKPFKGVRVAVPYGVSFNKAEDVVHSKTGWIKKHLNKMDRLEQEAIEQSKHSHMDRKDARACLVRRLDELSDKHGFTYNRVFVKNQKTRWGSCSEKNNINLNANLVRLPDELMDYTILHELVHTRVKNHSKRFWDELDKLVGESRKLDRKLSRYRVLLIGLPNSQGRG
ncbi:MAG: YgjP-like metallopeptidase domain-containing protein [Desulfatiglandaceae bacterium]